MKKFQIPIFGRFLTAMHAKVYAKYASSFARKVAKYFPQYCHPDGGRITRAPAK